MKLYTRTVCPKCMWVKTNLAVLEYEVINIDHDAEAMELIKGKGYMSVPILEDGGQWFSEVPEMLEYIESIKELKS